MATKPPSTSAMSPSNFILRIEAIIRRPTTTRAGVVAKLGMARKTGERKRATMKRAAVVRAVKPVRPPWATPAEDST